MNIASSGHVVRVLWAALAGLGALWVANAMSGPLEWILVSLLILVGAWILDPRADARLGTFSLVAIAIALSATAILGYLRVEDTASDHNGTLAHPPLSGGSDQIDFTSMAYTFYQYTVPGTGRGERLAGPVIDWAVAHGEEGSLLERWGWVRDGAEGPEIYTYRPHFYPVLLGSVFKVTGYDPGLGPVMNAVLFGLTASLLIGFVAHVLSWFAGYIASALFMTIWVVRVWARQNMPETLAVFLVTLFVIGLYVALSTRLAWRGRVAVFAGVVGGLLALTKQMFLVVGVIVGGGLLLWAVIRRRGAIRPILIIGATTIIVLLPWMAYNIAGTGRSDMLTGTEGWHDFPSVYSQEYLEGGNRFEIREQIFANYELETGQAVSSSLERALVGREIFLENLRSGQYWDRLPSLISYKFSQAIAAPLTSLSDQLIRVMAVVGLAMLAVGGRWVRVDDRELLGLVLGLVMIAPFVIVSIDFPDLGRLVMSSWIPSVILAGMSVSAGVKVVVERVEARNSRDADRELIQA